MKERVAVPWRPSPQAHGDSTKESLSSESTQATPVSQETTTLSSDSTVETNTDQIVTASRAPEEISDRSSQPATLEKPPQPSVIPVQVVKSVEEQVATVESPSAPSDAASTTTSSPSAPDTPPRTLSWRNFEVALKEITPSSSESHASLVDLRKWNEEFGEGQTKKRKVMWGKGLFGFAEIGEGIPDGKVSVQDRSATEVDAGRW